MLGPPDSRYARNLLGIPLHGFDRVYVIQSSMQTILSLQMGSSSRHARRTLSSDAEPDDAPKYEFVCMYASVHSGGRPPGRANRH